MHLDIYPEYLRQLESSTESSASIVGHRRIPHHEAPWGLHGSPYQVMLNVDGINIYTKTYVATDCEQVGHKHLGQAELKVRRVGKYAMMEQDAVHIDYEPDVASHLLDIDGRKIGITGLLDSGAVVSLMPIKNWEKIVFTSDDLIPTNLRLAAANRGATYVAGRTPIIVLKVGDANLWTGFLE